jgi:hypothetical protein
MKLSWLVQECMKRIISLEHRPTKIRMSAIAFDQYQDALEAIDPPDLGYARFKFMDADVVLDTTLEPGAIEFVMGTVKVTEDAVDPKAIVRTDANPRGE